MIITPYAFGHAISAYAAEVAADAPLSWWRLGERSGTTAVAAGSSPVNGVYNLSYTLGVAGLITNDSNKAFAVDPNFGSGFVNMGAPAALRLSRSFTIEAWFLQGALSLGGLLSFNNGGYYMRTESNGKLSFLKSAQALIGTGATVLLAGSKHHGAITVDADGNWAIYADGVMDASGSTTAVFTGAQLVIGIDRPSIGAEVFTGTIDEVAIYGYALSPARIAAHYAAGM